MECLRVAVAQSGIKFSKYYSSEVDEAAQAVARKNHPDINHLGDVTRWREWGIDWGGIDLLVGGSPCQGFSFAGKRAGTRAEIDGVDVIIESREQYTDAKEKGAKFYSQSHLFWEYVLCLDHARRENPNVKFLLENTRMKPEILSMISEALGVSPMLINSGLVSAQSRDRYYWFNWHVERPIDEGITLESILEIKDYKGVKIRGKSRCVRCGGGGSPLDSKQVWDSPLSNENFKTHAMEDLKRYRRYSVLELERLQALPDGYTDGAGVSKTQIRKMIGNSFTVSVIEHILRGINE